MWFIHSAHRRDCRLFWKWKSKHRGRLRLKGRSGADSTDGREQSDVGQERIAAELLVKLGLRFSPRTMNIHLLVKLIFRGGCQVAVFLAAGLRRLARPNQQPRRARSGFRQGPRVGPVSRPVQLPSDF